QAADARAVEEESAHEVSPDRASRDVFRHRDLLSDEDTDPTVAESTGRASVALRIAPRSPPMSGFGDLSGALGAAPDRPGHPAPARERCHRAGGPDRAGPRPRPPATVGVRRWPGDRKKWL